MTIYDTFEQGSEEWHKIRQGKVGGSTLHKLISEPRNKSDRELGLLGTGGMTTVYASAAEPLCFAPDVSSGFANADHGHLNEPLARDLIAFETGIDFKEYAWIERNPFHGHSPDGLVLGKIGLEIKSPASYYIHKQHMLWRNPSDIKNDHRTDSSKWYWQCINGMLVCEVNHWLFASYCKDHSPRINYVLFDAIEPDVKADIELAKNRVDRFEKWTTDKAKEYELAINSVGQYQDDLFSRLQEIAA